MFGPKRNLVLMSMRKLLCIGSQCVIPHIMVIPIIKTQNKGSFPIHPMDHPCINAHGIHSSGPTMTRAEPPDCLGKPAIRASVSLPRAGRTPEPPILFLRPKKVPACWSLVPPETFHLATHGLRVRMSWGRGKGRAFTVEKRTLFEVLNEDPKHWNPKIVN